MELLTLPDVVKLTCCSRAFVVTKSTDGRFPAPLHLGERKRVWLKSEVESWLADRVAARPQVP